MKKILSVFILICFIVPVFGEIVLAEDYILAPNDQLEVRIIGQKYLDTKQSIAPDGTISLPLLGREMAQGHTLNKFNNYLSIKYSKYIKDPQVIVYLTPRPIYVIQHDLKTHTWDVKEAQSITEAKAYAGGNYYGEIKHGDVVSVEVNKKNDDWEVNWYKVITGVALMAGIYVTLHK